MAAHEWLTSAEAARVINYSAAHLARLRMEGGGPPFVKRGRAKQAQVRYRVSALEEWMLAQLRSSTSDAAEAAR
jgi:hypothetical protein